MIEMKVKGLTLDPLTNVPIVILREAEGERSLPIWVGIFEAHAIAREIEEFQTPRPMTHDLIKNIINGVKGKVTRILVSDLRDNTFFAEILLAINGSEISIDSRPSDAIALALRMSAPIFVEEKVLEEAKSIEFTEPEESEGDEGDEGEAEASEKPLDANPEDVKRWLENLTPDDFLKSEN
jgi:bifunctional DNase/RNase